ncbi:MAG: MFS transporter [Firmicutes bacterium]|nr:MFS transporter [Bacillota bacterium]
MSHQAVIRVVIFVLIWLAAFSCRTTIVAIGPLLPVLIKTLHLSSFWAGSLTAVPLFIIALASIPSGQIADRLGHRLTLVLALSIMGVGSLVPLPLTKTIGLFLDVIAVGIGIGLAQPTLAKLARAIDSENPARPTTLYANGLVMGGFIASLTTAPVILPLVGGGWSHVLAFWGALALLTVFGWLAVFTHLPAEITSNTRTTQPFPPSPGFYAIAASFAAQGAIFYALATWLPEYFVRHGWTLAHASLPLAIVSLGSIAGGLSSPWFLRRGQGFKRPFIIVSLALALATAGLAIAPSIAYLWAILIGATTAIIFTLGMAAPAVLFPPAWVGRASGLLLAIGYAGAVAGPLGFGALTVFGFTIPMIFLLGLSLAITAFALRMPRDIQRASSVQRALQP